ncbi:tyrosine-type recombinase/integrase [Vibrio gallicus]|uniref:tyrosine-type recombinase/integrase n=1 Tax=Vibrio gallicus TaxID=190897 RepID=UPI0021C2D522|nr:site-specific integrase [Vibrio gallicus]
MTTTFKYYANLLLEQKKHEFQKSTFTSYQSKTNYLVRYFGRKKIRTINHSGVQKLIIELHNVYRNKTINEFFTILRAVFNAAEKDGVIDRSPMASFSNLKTTAEEPTPFTLNEIRLMNQSSCSCPSGKHLLLLGTHTGLRISELLALTWESIDLEKGVMKVLFANVEKELKIPKTPGSVRTIELTEPALTLLKKQYRITGSLETRLLEVTQEDIKVQKRYHHRYVFINSKKREPFLHSKQYQKSFYNPFIKALGIAHRGPNQARHTFASQALTAGINKQWIANCLGHRNTEMVDRHYARWIKPDAQDHGAQFSQHMQQAMEQPKSERSDNVISFSKEKNKQIVISEVSVRSHSPKHSVCDGEASLQHHGNPLRSHCTFSAKKMQHELRAREGSFDFRLVRFDEGHTL